MIDRLAIPLVAVAILALIVAVGRPDPHDPARPAVEKSMGLGQ